MNILHALGRHGDNWRVHWYLGNVWRTCRVCGVRRQVTGAELTRTSPSGIEGNPDDGLVEWRTRMGIEVSE